MLAGYFRVYLLRCFVCLLVFVIGFADAIASSQAQPNKSQQANGVLSRGKSALNSFADILDPLLPSVVNIYTTMEVNMDKKRGGAGDAPAFPGGTPLEEFFRQFMDEYQNRMPRKTSSLGTGFIISQNASDVYVVTCYHLIADADEIKVKLTSNKEFKAKIVGVNRRTDLAVLKFTSKEKVSVATWGNSSEARVGDWVIAVGNPFGLSSTVTAGIISTIARDIGGASRTLASSIVDGYIQTDASINMGNSGGPMFNLDGKVIGVNTAIYSPNGGSIGIGFAIPSGLASVVVASLIKNGHAMSGWLGVKIQPVTEEVADSIGLKEAYGALIGEVSLKGPADIAGLKSGDVILKIDNVKIEESKMVQKIIAQTDSGTEVNIVAFRDGKEISLKVKIGNFDEAEKKGLISGVDTPNKMQDKQKKLLGLSVQPLTPGLRDRISLPENIKGVVISSVDPSSEAAEKDIRPYDVISKIAAAGKHYNVETPEDYYKVVEMAKNAVTSRCY
jgi:serine protease Do